MKKSKSNTSSIVAAAASPAFNGVKVFSATMVHDRAALGEKVTAWLASHPSYQVADIVISQSSDQAFHCIAISVFYLDPSVAPRLLPTPKVAS